MPHRVMNLLWVLLGVLGVLVVGAMILLRIDPHRAARRGARWRRALLSAGLLLLSSVTDSLS